MNITYIHHSGFLVETSRFYYLFDYESGPLPEMAPAKPIFVLSSHSHADHYNPEIFSLLAASGMQHVHAILSDDITPPVHIPTLQVSPGKQYALGPRQTLTPFQSTDLGVAFLIEDQDQLIYHAGDLNDWVWKSTPPSWSWTPDRRKTMTGVFAISWKPSPPNRSTPCTTGTIPPSSKPF